MKDHVHSYTAMVEKLKACSLKYHSLIALEDFEKGLPDDYDGPIITAIQLANEIDYLARKLSEAPSENATHSERTKRAYAILEKHKQCADFREADKCVAELVSLVVASEAPSASAPTIALLQAWTDAFRNRGETTSLREWNDRMKAVNEQTRDYLYSIGSLPPDSFPPDRRNTDA